MSVKRYCVGNAEIKSVDGTSRYEYGEREMVDATDYDAALAVLRQCVEAMRDLYVSSGPLFDNVASAEEWEEANNKTRDAFAAARQLLEGEKP